MYKRRVEDEREGWKGKREGRRGERRTWIVCNISIVTGKFGAKIYHVDFSLLPVSSP